jgi:hypothetical protein
VDLPSVVISLGETGSCAVTDASYSQHICMPHPPSGWISPHTFWVARKASFLVLPDVRTLGLPSQENLQGPGCWRNSRKLQMPRKKGSGPWRLGAVSLAARKSQGLPTPKLERHSTGHRVLFPLLTAATSHLLLAAEPEATASQDPKQQVSGLSTYSYKSLHPVLGAIVSSCPLRNQSYKSLNLLVLTTGPWHSTRKPPFAYSQFPSG